MSKQVSSILYILYGALFISNRFEGGLIETEELLERVGGDSFNLAKTVVSVLNRGLEFKVEKLKNK